MERGLGICILRFIHPSKPIRDKYPDFPKTHNIYNLVLIAEAKKRIRRNSGVSNVYTFLHADFEGVEFYTARKYVHLKKAGRKDDFFVSEEYEEYDKVLPFSELTLLAEKRVGGFEIPDLPYLNSGQNPNLTSDDMAGIHRQGIAVNNNNRHAPETFLTLKKIPEHNRKRTTVGDNKE